MPDLLYIEKLPKAVNTCNRCGRKTDAWCILHYKDALFDGNKIKTTAESFDIDFSKEISIYDVSVQPSKLLFRINDAPKPGFIQ